MDQSLINWIIASAGALIGFVLKSIWDAVKDLQTSDKELADKVSRIEILVAGEYVKKDEFDKIIYRLFQKLDSIEEKVDGKADK
jgi:hypothetical protein